MRISDWSSDVCSSDLPFVESKNKQFGIYIQDDWEVTDKLTLNLGLRWDYEDNPSYVDYRVPDDLAAALRGWTNIQNADYDIDDYISTGVNRDNFKGAWQPRFGFSYDLFDRKRTRLHSSTSCASRI